MTNNSHYQQILSEIYLETKDSDDPGKVASYIPELSHINSNKFGVHLITSSQHHISVGDSGEKFSIQSVSKVLSLTLAFNLIGNKLWERVDVEPSGTAFNSLVQLEYEKGIPRNPFLNAGAIVVCDVLVSELNNPKDDLISFVRDLSGNTSINYNCKVAASEKRTGHRNIALTHLMKEFGNIKNDIDIVLDLYFDLCSIEMSCKELAQTFQYLVNKGINPINNKNFTSASKAKRINAIMLLCGFYDEAGEFAFRVGLPGKSGVGGGIIAINPEQYSIAVWSPKLNMKGNSYKGFELLEAFTTKSNSSIF